MDVESPYGRGPRLSDLLVTLGRQVLAPTDPALVDGWPENCQDPLLTELVVRDPDDPIPAVPGGVLVLVAGTSDVGAIRSDLVQAAQLGYAAAVLKRRGLASDDLHALAAASDVHLLVTPDDATWTAVLNLVNGALASRQAIGAGPVSDVATGDVFALANTIAAAAGGAVTIENVHREVLAYSNIPAQAIDDSRRIAILGRRVPGLPEYLDEYRTLAGTDGPVHFPAEHGFVDRVAVPIRVGGRLLGSVWVLDDGGRQIEAVTKVLVQTAPVVALHLVRAEDGYDLRRQHRSELLAGALGLPGQSGVAQLLSLRDRFPVVLFGYRATEQAGEPLDERRVLDILSVYAETVRINSLCAQIGDVVFVLLPQATGLTARRIAEVARSSMQAVERAVGVRLHCAHSDVVADMSRLAGVRSDIETALRSFAGAAAPAHSVCDVAAQRHAVLLQELVESAVGTRDRLLHPLREILDHDAEHGTFYAQTLLAHLDSFGDARKAAEWNSVHENSQRYRMRRVVGEFDLDLDDPAFRLMLWLQLRLNRERR